MPIVANATATAVSTALSSVFVALAIAIMEGDFFQRLSEVRMAVLVAPLNAMVAAAEEAARRLRLATPP